MLGHLRDLFASDSLEKKVIIHRKKKYGDWYIYPQFLAHENPKNAHKNAQKSNLAYTMLLVQGRISQKYGFQMCLLAVLGSQGIVVKCTTAILFPTVTVD